MSEVPLIPAATLILIRDRPDGPAELLMIQRAATMSFAASAWVFPGGRVDAADQTLAAELAGGTGLEAGDVASRLAAIRETIEEAGVPVGLDPVPDADLLATIRAGLHGGRPLADLLAETGLGLRLDALVPFARWAPPVGAPKRFDTRFYIARATEAMTVEVDGGESVATCWTSAADMLAREAAQIIFPTMSNLRRLAEYRTFDETAAHAALFPASRVTTEIREIDGASWLCIPEGQGYPDIRELIGALRKP